MEKDYSELFREYDLSCKNRNLLWNKTRCCIKDNESVLLQVSLCLKTDDGDREYHIYVVERNNKKYLKLIDIIPLDDILWTCQRKYSWSFIPFGELFSVGVCIPEYIEEANNNVKEYELDNKIDNILDEMSKINFEDYSREDFTCNIDISKVHYDCYDFVNKHIFTADGYCLNKYSIYADLLDYVFSITNNQHIKSSVIKKVDNLEEAYKEMVKRKMEN